MPVSSITARGALLLAALALLAAGCSGRRSVSPVSGQVFVGKKPAAGAMVTFHPVRDAGGPVYRPNGYADAQGRFALTTYTQGDGAPAGEYVVTVEWIPAKKSPFEADG